MRDMRLGIELGVRGTPTVFVNGMMFMGLPEPDDLDALLTAQESLGAALRTQTDQRGEALYEAITRQNAQDVADAAP